MKKTNKGITLIALVITIIVMLIIVAVTISMALKGGLFDYAGKATGDMQNAINKEQQLADGKIEVEGVIYNSIDDYVNDEPSGETTLISLYKAGKLKVGDYVDYKPSAASAVNPDDPEGTGNVAAGALTGFTENVQSIEHETELKWRVLGADGDKLLLISATPTNNVVNFYGHVGYNNYETVLNNVCDDLYGNQEIGATATNISMEDINTYLGGSAFEKTTCEGLEVFTGNFVGGYYGYTNDFTNIYTPNNWTGTYTGQLKSEAYYFNAENVITDETKLDLLLGIEEYDGLFFYLIASKAAFVSNVSCMWFAFSAVDGDLGCSTYVKNGRTFVPYLCAGDKSEAGIKGCLRPVITIPSNITKEDVLIIGESSLNTWMPEYVPYGGPPA